MYLVDIIIIVEGIMLLAGVLLTVRELRLMSLDRAAAKREREFDEYMREQREQFDEFMFEQRQQDDLIW